MRKGGYPYDNAPVERNNNIKKILDYNTHKILNAAIPLCKMKKPLKCTILQYVAYIWSNSMQLINNISSL